VMVFDEVDAGIGGQTAHEVAAALSELARTTQVIVVTHLPQVAAYADHHIRVTRDNTGTTVEALSDEEREIEVARMLGEIEGIAIARDLAAQLLAARRKSH
ncbi:MAG: DNA repair protein RecN, partial [Actinobacteria bacterium]|nr:DNA repair protein RecN [Actinomycetota bacterium]